MAQFLARQRDLSSTTFVPADAPRLATKGGTRCLGRARQLYRASGLSPAQYESATKRRDGSIGPHSLQRVRRRSASTKRSTSRSLRPIPARIAHRSLLRATARTLVLRADATVLPHRGAAGNDIVLSVSLPSRGVRLGGSSGAVSVLVSVVLVCGHPGAFERSLRTRRRRSTDQRGPRFADLESGLGSRPRGFESRILRNSHWGNGSHPDSCPLPSVDPGLSFGLSWFGLGLFRYPDEAAYPGSNVSPNGIGHVLIAGSH
jgi:hypothetical protein